MIRAPTLTRRAALLLAAGAAIAPRALAAPTVTFPLRIAVAKLTPTGLARLSAEQQTIWSAMAQRLGGLIESIEPVQPSSLITPRPPEVDGGRSALEQACNIAEELICPHLILFATEQPSRTVQAPAQWLSKALTSVRDVVTPDRMMGEVLLVGAENINVVARATTDVAPRFMIFGPEPETETVKALAVSLERRLQLIARDQYAASRSITDGVR